MKFLRCIILFFANALAAWQVQATDLTVDAAKAYQTIEGFGTSLTSWGDFPHQVYTDKFADFYLNEVGLSMLRMDIEHFQHAETDDPAAITWQTLAPNTQAHVYIDFAAKLKQRNPDVRLIATAWSPPTWLKMNRAQSNGSKTRQNQSILADSYDHKTNRVAPGKMDLYVKWLASVVMWFEQNGLPLYAVSPANEPRFSQWYGSCIFTGKDLALVIGKLGVELERMGLGQVKIFGPEDMTGHLYQGGTKSMLDAIRDNPVAWRQLDRIATHGYTNGIIADVSKESSLNFHAYISDFNKPYWMTEGGTQGHSWPEPVSSGVAQALHNSLAGSNAAAFLAWQISERKPTEHALAVLATATKKTYTAMHYFRSIAIGSRRIDTDPVFGTIQASAFWKQETGQLAIILLNPSNQHQQVNLALRNLPEVQTLHPRRTTAHENFAELPALRLTKGTGKLSLPPHSITSLTAERQHQTETTLTDQDKTP